MKTDIYKKYTILAVDDEPRILEIIKAYMESSGFKTICAKDGKEALENFEFFEPDLVVLDLMLPDMTGTAVCRKIRERSNVPVIMLTARADEESVVQGLNLGADGYITKPFSPKELLARVKAALRRSGTADAPPSRIACGSLVLDTEARRVEKDGVLVPLTRDEYNILLLFMCNPERVFSREEMIDVVKGGNFDGFDRAVDSNIKNLRKKIGDDSKNPVYIQTVYGMGYRFAGHVERIN